MVHGALIASWYNKIAVQIAFGAALFQILRRFYHTEAIPFVIESDEFNGLTKDNSGVVRPRVSRSYANLSQAEEENAQSRIYFGIHWSFDKTAGISQGRRVGDYVINQVSTPARRPIRVANFSALPRKLFTTAHTKKKAGWVPASWVSSS